MGCQAFGRNGTGSAHSLVRSFSNVEDSDLKISRHGADVSSCSCIVYPHLVGAQLCRLSPIDTYTVALKPVMGK